MFKVGDRVLRTAPSDHAHSMIKGNTYTVEEHPANRWMTLKGMKGEWDPRNFVRASTAYAVDATTSAPASALDVQVGGGHYKKLKIQPVEYIMANNIPYMEGNVVKYCTRWRDKGGVQDLEKAMHYLQMLIEQEKKNA